MQLGQWPVVKSLPDSAGDMVLVPGLRRFPGEGNSSRFQYRGLGKLMDKEPGVP